MNRIPAHMGTLSSCVLQEQNVSIYIKDIQAVPAPSFGMPAHQLHTEANSETQVDADFDQLIQRPVAF